MKLRIRTALVITMFIGLIYAAIGFIFSPTPADMGIGAAIVAAAFIAQGLIDWIER